MLGNQLVLYLQRIQLFDFLRQFRHLRDTVQPHQACHFRHQSSHVQINHGQVAAENLIGHVTVLQRASQTLYHQHTGYDIVLLTFCIDFVDGRGSKFHTCLLKLEIGGSSPVKQRNHHSQTGTDTESGKRSIYRVKSHAEIRAVVRLGFQIKNGYLIQKLLYAIGRCDIILPALTNRCIDKLCHCSKVFTRNPLVYILSFQVHGIFFQNILTRTVMFFPLNHCHRKTECFVLLHIRSTTVHVTVGQQPEKRIQFSPFSFRRFKCHNLSIF